MPHNKDKHQQTGQHPDNRSSDMDRKSAGNRDDNEQTKSSKQQDRGGSHDDRDMNKR